MEEGGGVSKTLSFVQKELVVFFLINKYDLPAKNRNLDNNRGIK